jgi:hypothetical protein
MVSLQDIKSSDNIGMRQGIIPLAIQRIAESPEIAIRRDGARDYIYNLTKKAIAAVFLNG